VVKQCNGVYKVRALQLTALHAEATELLKATGSSVQHVPRAENALADYLSNQAMDKQLAYPVHLNVDGMDATLASLQISAQNHSAEAKRAKPSWTQECLQEAMDEESFCGPVPKMFKNMRDVFLDVSPDGDANFLKARAQLHELYCTVCAMYEQEPEVYEPTEQDEEAS